MFQAARAAFAAYVGAGLDELLGLVSDAPVDLEQGVRAAWMASVLAEEDQQQEEGPPPLLPGPLPLAVPPPPPAKKARKEVRKCLA